MNKVLIIGINGVGKEHIRACENLKVNYDLFDKDIEEFRGKKEIWNIWGNNKNLVSLDYLENLQDDFSKIDFSVITHCIIATPDGLHSFYVDEVSKKNSNINILIEKPPMCNLDKVKMVGYSDFEVSLADEILTLDFNVEPVEKFKSDWKNLIELDLFGHLYYTYIQYYNYKYPNSLENIKVKQVLRKEENELSIKLYNGIVLTVRRKQKETFIVINGIPKHNDYQYIFTKQLDLFLKGHSNVDTCKFIDGQIEESIIGVTV